MIFLGSSCFIYLPSVMPQINFCYFKNKFFKMKKKGARSFLPTTLKHQYLLGTHEVLSRVNDQWKIKGTG